MIISLRDNLGLRGEGRRKLPLFEKVERVKFRGLKYSYNI